MCKYLPSLYISRVFTGKAIASLPVSWRLQQSSTKPSPGPPALSEGQRSRKPSLATTLLLSHSLLQFAEGWAKYLLFLLLPFQKIKITEKTPLEFKSQKSSFNYLTYNYIQTFNYWLQSIFSPRASMKMEFLSPPRNTPNHHLLLHLQSVLFTNICAW